MFFGMSLYFYEFILDVNFFIDFGEYIYEIIFNILGWSVSISILYLI